VAPLFGLSAAQGADDVVILGALEIASNL